MKIYADTSKLSEIFDLYENNKVVQGFTTNPSLMRKAGITDYIGFLKEVTSKIKDYPFSFEIFADELPEMEYQVQKLAEYGDNIYVKVPIMNTKGESTIDLIAKMISKHIKLNVTAIFTERQMEDLMQFADTSSPMVYSVFAGRIADTGIDPSFSIGTLVRRLAQKNSDIEVLWASVREVYNIYEADKCGCDIITVTPDVIAKYIASKSKDLHQFSKETVQMFYNDATSAGYTL